MKVTKYLAGMMIRKVVKDELKLDIKKLDTVELVKKKSDSNSLYSF